MFEDDSLSELSDTSERTEICSSHIKPLSSFLPKRRSIGHLGHFTKCSENWLSQLNTKISEQVVARNNAKPPAKRRLSCFESFTIEEDRQTKLQTYGKEEKVGLAFRLHMARVKWDSQVIILLFGLLF
eukprot:GHVL01044075.1.p1 GENE.GHVL01044075.1~~GHVL01044075.1.p1  ORF type:complete len:128 (+),score=12.69 GHVL01044075.1:68-451(+)